ncbi:penicillin-insensitive murein endopeptidase [Acidisoma cladoniae]|jgi:penicillin-insensitive murein endopeptidase|uniref:penicillin-insensitive murein endopeptidase n=1 Tax=Acidisoma cladoniae TaxID=3040935 RepID=UPI00254EF8D2|nr:penicillin-insensitive murein endopeptidase [Acidisoma sp. PAMC 29798]
MRLRFLMLLPLLAPPAYAGTVGPAPGALRIIGAGTGCIVGARALPPQGPGYEVIRASQSSFWGAPVTLRGIETLAAEAQRAGLPDLYVGDLSGPRGGPLSGGHVAHQRGLDVDIYLDTQPKPALTLAQRNGLAPPAIVPAGSTQVDPAQWSRATMTLIHMATALPGLDRLLVNPVIKRQLCEAATGDTSWLRRVRPWWGHRAHMHLHFACPPGQPDCVDQAAVPAGNGCGAALDWWFMPDGSIRPPPPSSGGQPPAIPAACGPILAPLAGGALPQGAEAN